MSPEEEEWRDVPTDLAGWSVRAVEMLRERDRLLADLRILGEKAKRNGVFWVADDVEEILNG